MQPIRLRHLAPTAALAGSLLLAAACGAGGAEPARGPAPATTAEPVASPSTATTAAAKPRRRVAGSVVRFSRASARVDVTITSDNRASRDLLAMLPLKLKVEEFAGKEKISYLPRKLKTRGAPGSDPEDGDLIYYVPWGNLGFYYDASGIGYADDTIPIGTYNATEAQLSKLEGGTVSVRLVKQGPKTASTAAAR